MAEQRFSITNYPTSLLVEQIDSEELGLPDLQRPFVWKRSQVRDLFDSLYRGYPAGYFLLWNPPSGEDSHGIGVGSAHEKPRKMIVDGQQRLTSLYAVMKAKEIIDEDNDEQLIRIAFNPLREEFAVANAASDRDPEWLSNVSEIWTEPGGLWTFTNGFIGHLSEARELSELEKQRIGDALSRLESLTSYQFPALELSAELDVEVVAEVFQRINSRGVSLNSADFILTLMSVFWKEGRHALEDFARAAKRPSGGTPSPYNYFHQPSPDQLLRVAVGLALKRGVLQAAYQVLRGRDPETREVSEDLRKTQFGRLAKAQEQVLNLTSWHEYMVAVKQAGFRSGDMLTSANNFLYSYLVFLIGRTGYGVGATELRNVVSRWFFMSSLTGRYTGSPETIVEADLRRIGEAKTATEFVALLDSIVDNQLTEDFWSVNLPDYLDSSASWSPYLFAYYAALNLLDAKALFSRVAIHQLLDPGVVSTRSPVERHHLFPKAYLSRIGVTGTTRTNQIANFAFLEWSDNLEISDRAPAEYFPAMWGKLSAEEQKEAAFHHALPGDWEVMDYFDFLAERRRLIAKVVKAGFLLLKHGPSKAKAEEAFPSVAELLHKMETLHVEFKASARVPANSEVPEKVINGEVIKTVAALMNSDGGTLGIGITDDGDVVGIQPDLDLRGHDLDGYQNWLTGLLVKAVGGGAVSAYTSSRFEAVGDKMVCLVDVKPSSVPVYADSIKGDEVFWVRANNSSRMLQGRELELYIRERFS